MNEWMNGKMTTVGKGSGNPSLETLFPHISPCLLYTFQSLSHFPAPSVNMSHVLSRSGCDSLPVWKVASQQPLCPDSLPHGTWLRSDPWPGSGQGNKEGRSSEGLHRGGSQEKDLRGHGASMTLDVVMPTGDLGTLVALMKPRGELARERSQ